MSEDGILFSKDGTTLLRYPNGKNNTKYIVPDGVQTIGDSAFLCSNNISLLYGKIHFTTTILSYTF